MPIRKRNLDNSLIQWIMTVTGLGPGIGEIKYVAPAASSTSQYRTQLQQMGVDDADIFTTPKLAHAAIEAHRNDVVLVFPAEYFETGTDPFTFDTYYAHMMGLQHRQTTVWHAIGAVIATNGTTSPYAMESIGKGNQYHNLVFANMGAATAAISGLKESSRKTLYKGCAILGQLATLQAQNADCTSLWINTSKAGYGVGNGVVFEDCVIGSSGGPTRTQLSGTIRFGPTGVAAAGSGMEFRNCRIEGRAEDNDPCAVKIEAANCVDRLMLFDRCVFYNFSENHGTAPDYVIRDACNTTHDILLKDCTRVGFDAWTNLAAHCFISSGTTQTTAGGVAVAAA